MKIHSFTREGKFLINSINPVYKHLFPKSKGSVFEELLLITPQASSTSDISYDGVWGLIHEAWRKINFANTSSCLSEWRIIFDVGQEVFPGLRIFRLKECGLSKYFFLIDKNGMEAVSFLNDMLFILKTWQLIKKSKGFFHGAGIVHRDGASLFLGPSGAGKSTVSAFSAELGHDVIHDDHVVASKVGTGKYLLSTISSISSGKPLSAIYFLVQDKSDIVFPLSQTQTAQGLFKSLFELPSEKVLYGLYLNNAFSVCADIARAVPGYELHFTKSPNFWKVIEDETGL